MRRRLAAARSRHPRHAAELGLGGLWHVRPVQVRRARLADGGRAASPAAPLLDPVIVGAHGRRGARGATACRSRRTWPMAECPAPDVVCVPELLLVPDHARRPASRPRWPGCASCHAARRAGGHRLLGRHAAGRGRPARRRGRHHPLGLLRHDAAPPPARARAAAARAGHRRRRPAPGDGRRRQLVDGPGALPDRALRRHRGRDAGGAAQPDRLAPRRPAALRARGALAPGGGRADRPLPGLDRRPLRAPGAGGGDDRAQRAGRSAPSSAASSWRPA